MGKVTSFFKSKILWAFVAGFVIASIAGGSPNPDIKTANPPGDTYVASVDPSSVAFSTSSDKKGVVTMSQFLQVKNGMTYREVVDILGSEGEEMSRNEIGGYETVMYSWDGDKFASSMNVLFQNGKLTSKSQYGL